jgi:hypothetical protein
MNEELDELFEALNAESDEPSEALMIPDSDHIQEIKQVNAPLTPDVIDEPPIDVRKYHKKLDDITEDVITACKKDRAEIQEVVNLMFDEIRDARDRGHVPARGYTDNLTKLLEVKANVNMMAVKIMEVNAKMLAATKAGAMTINNNVAVAQSDDYLRKILDEPMNDSDKY